MRAGLVGIFFFAAVLALGHYFAAPMFCRGALSLPTLDPVQLCTDGALNRQGSMLLYFFAVAAAMFFGILAALIPGRRRPENKGPEKPETFEEIIAAQEKTAAPAAVTVAVPAVATAAAVALSTESLAASVPSAVVAEAKADEPQPKPIDPENAESKAEAAVTDAVLTAASGESDQAAKSASETDSKSEAESKEEKAPDEKAEEKPAPAEVPESTATAEAKTQPEKEATAAEEQEPEAQAASLDDVRAAFESFDRDIAALVEPMAKVENKPEPVVAAPPAAPEAVVPPAAPKAEPEAPAEFEPETLAAAEAISAGLSSNQSGVRKPFEGTVEELVERFRQLRMADGTNSVAQAQKLLDESTLGALAKGIDPKQHLSDVAHQVLAEDPDLKSSVVRGVVVHIASRLKELGVAQRTPA
ncbi:MAG TPA: hypothetical protein PL193_14625 [Xanthobacteraceae bacterium]|nr:hypothetical protein [Xanthobacteraceae bacterium]